MRKLPKYVAMMAISMAATAVLPTASFAQGRDGDRDRERDRGTDEKIIRAQDLPEATRRTIEREAVGTNHWIDLRDRDDKIRYVVHFTAADGRRMRIRVDERGELIEAPNLAREQIESRDEVEHARDEAGRNERASTIREGDVPDRARKTFEEFSEDMHNVTYRRQTRDGRTLYSMYFTTPPGERKWVRVREDGEVDDGPHIAVAPDLGLRIAGAAAATPGGADTADLRRAEIGADELPANIRRVLEDKTAGGAQHRFFRETAKDGTRTYFTEYAKGDKQFQMRVNERGEVVFDKEVTLAAAPAAEELRRAEIGADELPGNLRRVLEEKTTGGTEHRFFRETSKDGVRTYFVEYKKDGQNANVRIDERGTVLAENAVASRPQPRPAPQPNPVPLSDDDAELAAAGTTSSHVMIPVGDLPPEVRQAFEKATKGGNEHIVQRHTQEGRTFYTAHYRTADDNHNFVVVDDRGQVVVEPRESSWLEAQKGVRFEPVPTDQLPGEVRAAIEKQAPQATEHLVLRRVRPNGDPTYLVQFTNAKGRRMQMEVNTNGRVREAVSPAQENPFRLVRGKERDKN